MHQAFNFQFLRSPWDAGELRAVIDESLRATGSVGAATTWVLSNHDVVRHSTRYAPDDPEQGLRRARAAALLMLALPGSAYIYQGEELGLPEVTDLPDTVRQDPSFLRSDGQDGLRDGCRVPIPWSGTEEPYGFGPKPGGPSWLPQPDSWAGLSVEAQTGDPGSTLELYRNALALRREHPALGAGDTVEWLDAPDGVLTFRRTARPDDGRTEPNGAGTGSGSGSDSGSGSGSGSANGNDPREGTGPTRRSSGENGGEDTRPEALVCTLNTLARPVELRLPGRPLLTSAPLSAPAPRGDGGTVRIPAESCAWWAI